MSPKSRAFKLSLALTAFGVVTAAGFSARWTNVLAAIGTGEISASQAASASSGSVAYTIGTCDTAGPIEVEASGGTTSPTAYPTLKDAFDAINAGTHQGSIKIEVCGNTTEAATASLSASGSGSASYTDVLVRPVGGARIIEGSIVGAIVKLNGADNVTLDGRQGGSGTARDLTIRNNSTSAATAAIWLASVVAGNGATNDVIRNLEIAAGQTANTGTNTTIGIYMGGTTISLTATDGNDNDNNQFIFNRVIRARYGIATRGVTTNNNFAPVITDNIIGPSAFGADEIGKAGIYMQADTGAIVSRNVVQFVGGDLANSTAGADRCGICIGSESWSVTDSTTITSGDYSVTKNVIHDIVEERTFSSMGIRIGTTRSGSATNNLIANNFIYNVRSDATSGDQVVGIAISGGHTDKVVFNSISLTGDQDPGAAALSTNFGNAIRVSQLNGSSHANLTLADNSIYLDVNASTPTTHFYAITANSAAYSFGTGFENFNNYYINSANPQLRTGGLSSVSGAAATTESATLAIWQTAFAAPQDANSIQADPIQISINSELHILGSSPNINVGTSIAGVTDDIDSQVRPNGVAPDIGADEFYALPGALQLSAATYGGNEGTSLNVTINRVGGSSGAVSVDYTLANGTATGGSSCSGSTDFINPGTQTLSFGDGITSQSFNVTLCSDGAIDPSETFTITLNGPLGGATLGSPTTATATITDVPPPFSGSIIVGTGQTYTSLTNSGGLFEAINLGGANGDVTINISSDLSGETGSFALNEVAGGFGVTIKPSGAARTITGSSINSIIRLNGADNVTIDGSLSGGTGSGVGGDAALRNLTIQNTNAAATAGAVIAVTQGGNSANNVTIKNVIISGQDPTQTLIGIHVGGNTIGAAPTTASNNNVVVDNCAFKRSFIAVFNDGVSAATPATGNKIIHNDITATGADRVRRAGIFVFNQNGIEITDNAIGGIVADEAADAIGIIAGVQNVNATVTTSGGISNSIIAENRISGISNTNTTGFSAVGIALAGDPAGQNFIGNNMISGIAAPATSPDIVAGIFVAGVASSNTHLFYNSVSMTGDRGAVASQIGSYGVAVSGTNPVVELKDNIFYTTQTSGGGANAKSYAIGMTSATFTNLSSNYNDFVSTGANAGGFRTGSLDTTGTDLANLAAWQAATGGDGNSLAADPLFANTATDLHIQMGSPMVNAGTVIAAINKDFDGQTRDAMPDIGADELGDTTPPDTTIDTHPPNPSTSSSGSFTFSGTDMGGSGLASFECKLDAAAFATCTSPVNLVGLSQGSHTFQVRAKDGAGNIDPTPASFTWLVDAIAPDTMILTHPADPSVSPDATFTFSGSDSLFGVTITFECKLDGGSFAACSSPKTYLGLTNGMHTFQVRSKDSVGNVDPTPASFTWTITTGSAGPVSVTASAGTASGTYTTLTDAIAAVNNGTHQGNITVNINQSTTEPGSIVINGSGAGMASYTSLVIRPTADTVTVAGTSVQGRGLIELNGADNVTIDGDNPNSGGINRNLTLQNTAASTVTFTSVLRIALAVTVVTSADNVTFKNLNILGSATGRNTSTATSTTGTENTTFGVVATAGASTTDATLAPSAITSVTTTIGTGATANNFTVTNNSINAVARAISVNGAATTVFPALQIANNRIGNQTGGDPDQVYAIGITAQGSANAVVSGNTVWVEGWVPSSTAGQAINVGVINASVTGATIANNKINRVRNNNTTTFTAAGINLAGGSSHIVQNNFISGVINDQTAGTGGFGSTFGSYGIRISSGTGHKIYHNSVHLYGALGGVTSTDATVGLVISSATLTGIDVRNNIFSNQITGGSPTGTRHFAVMLPAAATSAMNLTINNNAYYVSSDPQARLANASTSLNAAAEYLVENFDPTQTTPSTNWRAYTSQLSAASTNDNASFATTALPPFTSNVDLHIPAGTPTRLESGGAAVGVTADIDAEARSATTPDIGADEFAGNPPAANDIAAATFVYPTNGSTVPTGSFTPQAKFTNNGTVTQTNVTVRFRITDSSMSVIYNQTASIPSINPLQSVTVSFPTAMVPNPGAYTMEARVELVGDSVPGNDSINGSFNAVTPLTGTISVGTGQTYTSLTNPGGLFEALNLAGISGNVTINITSDLTAETGAVVLNQLAESGVGGYTLTIKPSGAARTISGAPAPNVALITLNGADRIVIDGSLSGSTDRSLTITNNQTSTTTVIWMRSPTASNGATNNTIKNCIINGAAVPNSTTTAGILTGSGTTLGSDAESPNSNNTIQNNWIYRVQNSMYIRGGTTAANFDQNWTVVGNELGSTNANDKNIFRGMLIGNSKNFTISGNTIHGIQSTGTTTAAMSGIQLALLLDSGTVTNNMISDIKNVSATGTGAAAISVIATSTASNVTIANNFISDVATTGSATVANNGFGIAFNGSGTGYNLYFNSFNLGTDQGSAQTSAAMFINSTFATAGALNVRNNIFANTQTTGSRYAVYSLAASTVFSAIDYNDYFAQNVGFIGGSTRATLSDWQTAAGGDGNSKAANPLFVSASDLHIQNGSPMINMAVTGTGILTDIDNQTRGAQPDIGADEILGATVPGTVQFSSANYSVAENGGTVTLTFTRTVGSDGAISATFSTANGTAVGGASCTPGVDYVSITGGTVNWASGDSAPKTAAVTICNDAAFEADETFTAAITGTTGGATTGSPSSTTVTITNDDPAPLGTITVNDVRVTEGNSSGMNAQFTVTYTGVNPASATVQYATANGRAIAGSDYVAVNGTINFGSSLGGNQTVTRTVSVPIIGDTVKEANETFFLNLSSAVNATITDNQGVAIIVDEDRPYAADFDGDLTADLSIFRASEGNWYIFNSQSLTNRIVHFGLAGERPVPGDYDGDGKTDVAMYRPSDGLWYAIFSSDGTFHSRNWGVATDKPVQGDYDGDGKTDIAIFRPSTAAWWIIRSSDDVSYTINFGLATDRLVQGDYDGDFKTDIAVYRDGTWYIQQSSNGNVVTQNFGLASDVPVAGDFDGDGRNDITVYRNGAWWILNSLTGTVGVVTWGVSTDIPVPADYDHDGTTDFAIFRPSTGQWFVLRSSNGSYFALVWGQNGDVPIESTLLPQ